MSGQCSGSRNHNGSGYFEGATKRRFVVLVADLLHHQHGRASEKVCESISPRLRVCTRASLVKCSFHDLKSVCNAPDLLVDAA